MPFAKISLLPSGLFTEAGVLGGNYLAFNVTREQAVAAENLLMDNGEAAHDSRLRGEPVPVPQP
jgi:hypothetical protein